VEFTVDTSPPVMDEVDDSSPLDETPDITYDTQRLRVKFVGHDFESGISRYRYRLFERGVTTPVEDWTSSTKEDDWVIVSGSYTDGSTYEFEIRYNSPDMLKKVQTAISHMIGFETTTQKKNSMIVKDITGPSDEEFSTIFRRLFLLILDVFQDGIAALKRKDKGEIQTLRLKDVEINKFSHFCLRKINKGDIQEEQKARIYYFLCILLEKIADGFKDILNKNYTFSQIKSLDKITKLLRLCYEFTFTTSPKKAIEIADAYDKIKSQKLPPEFRSLTELIILIQNQQLSLA